MASKLTGNGPGSQEKVTAVRTTTRIARTRRTRATIARRTSWGSPRD